MALPPPPLEGVEDWEGETDWEEDSELEREATLDGVMTRGERDEEGEAPPLGLALAPPGMESVG